MKTDRNIEKFTKYIMKEAQVESPSPDFLNKVMNSVKIESEISSFKVYQPLISKPAWVIITTVFVALIIFILTSTSGNYDILSSLDFSFFDKLSSIHIVDKIPSIHIFDNIHFSNIFTFSIMFFSVLVIFQIVVIKNYINRGNSTL
jgi:hypothetical protein